MLEEGSCCPTSAALDVAPDMVVISFWHFACVLLMSCY